MTPGARWLSVRPSPAPLVIAARANLGNVHERRTFPGILPGGVALYEIPRDADILPFMLAEVHSFAVQGEPGACLLDEDVGSVRHVLRLFQPPVELRHRATPFPGSVNLRRLYLRTLRLQNIIFRAALLLTSGHSLMASRPGQEFQEKGPGPHRTPAY